MADLENQAADILNDVISAFMSGGEAAAKIYIDTVDPGLLEVPVLGWLITEGLTYVGQIISVAGEKFGDALIINFQTGSEKSNVLSAGTALAIAQASGDEKAIQAAIAQASLAWRSAIHFDGFSSPT